MHICEHSCIHREWIRTVVILSFFTSLCLALSLYFSWLSIKHAEIAPGLFSASCILPEVSRSGLFHYVLQLYLVSCHPKVLSMRGELRKYLFLVVYYQRASAAK